MHLQTQKHGCGVYSLANALMLSKDFIQNNLYNTISGSTLGAMNIFLQKEGLNLYLHPLYFSSIQSGLPSNHNFKTEAKMPLILCVQTKEGEPGHMVAAHIEGEVLTVFDSLRESAVVTDFNHLNKLYFNVYGVLAFCGITNGEYLTIS